MRPSTLLGVSDPMLALDLDLAFNERGRRALDERLTEAAEGEGGAIAAILTVLTE